MQDAARTPRPLEAPTPPRPGRQATSCMISMTTPLPAGPDSCKVRGARTLWKHGSTADRGAPRADVLQHSRAQGPACRNPARPDGLQPHPGQPPRTAPTPTESYNRITKMESPPAGPQDSRISRQTPRPCRRRQRGPPAWHAWSRNRGPHVRTSCRQPAGPQDSRISIEPPPLQGPSRQSPRGPGRPDMQATSCRPRGPKGRNATPQYVRTSGSQCTLQDAGRNPAMHRGHPLPSPPHPPHPTPRHAAGTSRRPCRQGPGHARIMYVHTYTAAGRARTNG